MRDAHYELGSISRVRYEATPGLPLKVVAEATDLKIGETSVFEVRLGKVDKFTTTGVEVVRRTKSGRLKDAANKNISFDSLMSGDASVDALNGGIGSVRRLEAFP